MTNTHINPDNTPLYGRSVHEDAIAEEQPYHDGLAAYMNALEDSMTNTPITPAMTLEEWRIALHPSRQIEEEVSRRADEVEPPFHQIAALCLHNQPFGFDQEDVRSLRDIAAWIEVSFGASKSPVTHPMARDLWNLSDRISALLPPEL